MATGCLSLGSWRQPKRLLLLVLICLTIGVFLAVGPSSIPAVSSVKDYGLRAISDWAESGIRRTYPTDAEQDGQGLTWEVERTRFVAPSADRFAQRRLHYARACATTPASPHFTPSKTNTPRLIRVGGLAFCSLPKTGTTLWKSILYYILDKRTKPFHSEKMPDVHKAMEPLKTLARNVEGPVKTVVFVREPYSRLLSAYVNKLFKPNSDNWKVYGAPVVKYLRGRAGSRAKNIPACRAATITFPEFVSFFLAAETGELGPEFRNPHYIPQSQHCGFCTGQPHLDRASASDCGALRGGDDASWDGHPESWRAGFVFDFIGRTEDISRDTVDIFAAVNMSKRLPPGLDIRGDENRRKAGGLARQMFRDSSVFRSAQACLPKAEALRRLWKNLQVRGILSRRQVFPLTDAQAERADEDRFYDLVDAAAVRSQRDPGLRANKRAAMTEAYSLIPLQDRRKLREVFNRDFQLFNYSATIPEVFPLDDQFPDEQYKFFDIFDEDAS